MPCSERDCETPSLISAPLTAPSTEIVQSASGELDFVTNEITNDFRDKGYRIPLRNTKTMATLTQSTSSGGLSSSSSIVSLSSATSMSSALSNESDDNSLGTTDSCKASMETAVLRPTQIPPTIGSGEDANGMPDEGPRTSAPRGMEAGVKGKTPIQEIPRTTNTSSSSTSASNVIDGQKSPLFGNQTSIFIEDEEPWSHNLESSSSSCDGEDDGLAVLSASISTIRPRIRTGTITEPSGSRDSSLNEDAPEHLSTLTSPHSDQGYTFEVRPPSSVLATRDGEEQDIYDSPPTSQFNSPQSRSTLSPTHPSRSSSRRPNVVRVASPPELPPIPPVASARARRPRPHNQDTPQLSSSSTRQSSLSDRGSSEYYRASHTSSWHRPSRSPHNQAIEEVDAIYAQSTGRSTSTASLSPLAWDTTQITQWPTWSTSVPTLATSMDYSWLSEGPDIQNATVPSPSIPLLSTPTFRPAPTPNVREDAYSQSGRMQFLFPEAGLVPSPDPPVSIHATGLSNSPSVPPPTTRFTVPLPSSGSSLRSSAFNSPFAPGASPADSWGTPVTVPGEPVYNQTTRIPGEPAQWSDLAQPPASTRNPTSTWLPEANANGHNLSWTSGDQWSAWTDPTQIPQVGPTTPPPPYVTPPGYLLICRNCRSPPAACVCRRWMAPVPTGATSAGLRTPMRRPAAPHPGFWFADGTVILEVEDVYFKVHKYFFEYHSEHFRMLFARRLGASANLVPVRIPDAKKLDFERLLKVFYPSHLTNPDLSTVEEWTSILTLAVKWHMEELILLAIQELTPITSAVDKISLARKFGLFGYNLVPNSNYNRDWLLPALRELCGRNFPLRFEEARKLDMRTVVKIWEVQHEISNAGLSRNVSQIERLIKRRFGLE